MDAKIYVVIATAYQRRKILLSRSLTSIYLQGGISLSQIEVFVVDDNLTNKGFFEYKKSAWTLKILEKNYLFLRRLLKQKLFKIIELEVV